MTGAYASSLVCQEELLELELLELDALRISQRLSLQEFRRSGDVSQENKFLLNSWSRVKTTAAHQPHRREFSTSATSLRTTNG
jgi:hypothetical protein